MKLPAKEQAVLNRIEAQKDRALCGNPMPLNETAEMVHLDDKCTNIVKACGLSRYLSTCLGNGKTLLLFFPQAKHAIKVLTNYMNHSPVRLRAKTRSVIGQIKSSFGPDFDSVDEPGLSPGLTPGTIVGILCHKTLLGVETWQKYIISDLEIPTLTADGRWMFHATRLCAYNNGPMPMLVEPSRLRTSELDTI